MSVSAFPYGTIAALTEKVYSMTAGVNGPLTGWARGLFGSINPDEPYKNLSFDRLRDDGANWNLQLAGDSYQTVFREMEITGNFGAGSETFIMLQSDSTYDGATDSWNWTPRPKTILSGQVYTVTFR